MSCTIYLLRHGIAGSPPPGGYDADRRLTPEGIAKMHRVARGLRHLSVTPEVILSSPYPRARETADIFVQVAMPLSTVEECQDLVPGSEPDRTLRTLDAYRGVRSIMLVGHEPSMGWMLSYLLTGAARLVPVEFKKAGAAAIQLASFPPQSAGMLQWFLSPKQLRTLGQGE